MNLPMRWLVGLSLALVCVHPLAAVAAPAVEREAGHTAAPESVRTLRLDAEVHFDTAGKVTRYAVLTPSTPSALQATAEKVLSALEFVPVQVDGRPVPARTFARLTFVARPQGDDYAVSMENIRFHQGRLDSYGDPVRSKQEEAEAQRMIDQAGRPIEYPRGLERAGISGAVMLQLLLRPDGSVEDVVAVQSALFNVNGRERPLDQARTLFETQAVRTVKAWKFTLPPEARVGADGRPDNQVLLPIFFTMRHHHGLNDPGQWRLESRSARRTPPWDAEAGSQRRIGISDVTGSEGALSLAQGPIRLKAAGATN